MAESLLVLIKYQGPGATAISVATLDTPTTLTSSIKMCLSNTLPKLWSCICHFLELVLKYGFAVYFSILLSFIRHTRLNIRKPIVTSFSHLCFCLLFVSGPFHCQIKHIVDTVVATDRPARITNEKEKKSITAYESLFYMILNSHIM